MVCVYFLRLGWEFLKAQHPLREKPGIHVREEPRLQPVTQFNSWLAPGANSQQLERGHSGPSSHPSAQLTCKNAGEPSGQLIAL